MEIKLNIKKPNDNTNIYYGSVILSTDSKYVHITMKNKPVSVSKEEFYKAVCALCE